MCHSDSCCSQRDNTGLDWDLNRRVTTQSVLEQASQSRLRLSLHFRNQAIHRSGRTRHELLLTSVSPVCSAPTPLPHRSLRQATHCSQTQFLTAHLCHHITLVSARKPEVQHSWSPRVHPLSHQLGPPCCCSACLTRLAPVYVLTR